MLKRSASGEAHLPFAGKYKIFPGKAYDFGKNSVFLSL
jgi:hypothetical protein